MTVTTGVSVLHLCSQGGADPSEDQEGHTLVGLSHPTEELFGTIDRGNGYVSRRAAESPSPSHQPSKPSSSHAAHRSLRAGTHLEDFPKEQLHHCNGSSGAHSGAAPLPGAGPPLLGMLSTACSASSAPPEPGKVIYPSSHQAKSSCSCDAPRSSIPTPVRAQSQPARPGAGGLCQSRSVTEAKGVPLLLGFTLTAEHSSLASVTAPRAATHHQDTTWQISSSSTGSRGEGKAGLGVLSNSHATDMRGTRGRAGC